MTTAKNLNMDTYGLILIMAGLAFGGGLASVISPAKLQNAAASIDKLGAENQVIRTAFVFAVLLWTVFSDPMEHLYSSDGWMAQLRLLGFSASDSIAHNGRVSGGTSQQNLDKFIATLIDKKRKVLDAVLDGYVTEEEAMIAELMKKLRRK